MLSGFKIDRKHFRQDGLTAAVIRRGETPSCLRLLKRHLAVAAIARPACNGKATAEL